MSPPSGGFHFYFFGVGMSKGRRFRETQVTRFNLDPAELQKLSLLVLQVLVQELILPGESIPDTKELCISVLSKDYLGK